MRPWWVPPPAKPRRPPPPPHPAPLDWQRDLDALRLLEASLLLSPAKDTSDAEARDRRVARLYRELADRHPTQVVVQKAYGDYLCQHGRSEEAILVLRRAQSLDANDADTADLLGSVYLQLGRAREASGQFQRAVAAHPDDPRYHFDLANVLYLFRHELATPPGLPDAEAVLIKSLDEFHRAAVLAPLDLRYAQAYAETFYILLHPDWEQALAAWKVVLALSGPHTDFANSHLARISLRQKRPEQAEGYLACIHDPQFDGLKAKMHAQAASLPPVQAPGPL